MNETGYRIDKRKVADSFSQAASTYDNVARLQQEVGEELLLTIPEGTFERVLDLGCGTGYFTQQLTRLAGRPEVLGLDLAPGMLHYARQQYSHLPIQWVGGDAEQLPLADRSVDLVFSSLAIQWCYNLTALFRHIHRVLQPGGVMVFSTLGPGSLQELKRAWQSVDDHQHVNDFVPVRELENAILGSGFATLELRRRRQVLHYPKLQRLTRELKGIGAHNLNDKRPSGLVSRAKLTRLISSYERYRNDNGLLPATYEVVYGVLRKSRLERN